MLKITQIRVKGHSPSMYGTLLSVSALSIDKLVQLANINISVKSLRRAVLMIMKKYMRTSEILCSFIARYIFGHFFPCYLRPMNNQGLETDGNTKSTEKKFFYIYYNRYTKLP